MSNLGQGWQVWTYSWSAVTSTGGSKPIPEHLMFGGKVFPTRKEAESAWYDTIPGANDHATYVKVAS